MVSKYKKYKIWLPDSGRPLPDSGRPTEAGIWRPDFIFFILLHHLLYLLYFVYTFYTFTSSFIFFYTLFILFILLHHDIELSAQSGVNNNRFETLLLDVL